MICRKENLKTISGKDSSRIQIKMGLYNFALYKFKDWCEMLSQNDLFCVFTTFLPDKYVLMKKFDFEKIYSIRVRKVRKSVLWDEARSYHKATVMFKTKNYEKGRKNLSYCFRFLEFGYQL
eukprot:TRINITY_DN12164_c0_g1_i1.p1 TRINITY_DN12164_c0_g1~~TRINITY_DN12164_c0_g1_i1.p1  ORF type:complete len:121 (-),score=11.11 TRINITY_DN12164_c0_g1_i1:118-480(-)